MNQPAVIKVLLIENSRDDGILVRQLITRSDSDRFNLIQVRSLEEACQRLKGEAFDVMLLALSLPEAPGLAALSAAQMAAPGVPIITLARRAEESLALMSVELGAQDYLVKAPGNTLSVSRIRKAIERTRAEERVTNLSRYDAVTGLSNRARFRKLLSSAITEADHNNRPFALILLDLDRFKAVNDSLGHHAGDQLLKAVARRLEQDMGQGDTVARLGGDEFAVLVRGIRGAQEAADRARQTLESLSHPFNLGGHELFVTPSIGVAYYPNGSESADALIKSAEAAMYRAKEQGRANYQFHSPGMEVPAVERLRLETGLRRALEREEFVLYYQPQVELATGRITGMEALLRWHHPKLGMVSPSQFIWLAEETGLIVPIGEWVLRTACTQARKWRDEGLAPLRTVVNLSARQFKQKQLLPTVHEALEDSGLDPEFLTLEITEGAMVENTRTNGALLSDLRTMGIRISIDDFGIGYSSLNYLKRFPVDVLKIDRSFVKDVPSDTGDSAIARAIIALARGLSLTVIAEGVENRGQIKFLKQEGCDGIQGFFTSRPLPSRAFRKLMTEGGMLPV